MVRQKKRRADSELCISDNLENSMKKPRITRSASSKVIEDRNEKTAKETKRSLVKTARSNATNKSENPTNKLKSGKAKEVSKAVKVENDSGNELNSFNSTECGISSEKSNAEKSHITTNKAAPKARAKRKLVKSPEANKSAKSKEDAKPKKVKVTRKSKKVKEESCSSEEEFDSVESDAISNSSDLLRTCGSVPDAKEGKINYDDTTKLLEQCEPSLIPVASCSFKREDGNEESSSSDSEWEEVEENEEQRLADYKPNIPQEGVEITIDCPELNIRKRKKKQFDEMEYIRLDINRSRKEAQLNVHKTHLLCLLAHGIYVNDVLNSSLLKGIALSLIPGDILSITSGKKVDKIDLDGIERIVKWFRASFAFEMQKDLFVNISDSLVDSISIQKSMNPSEYNLVFIVIARALGFKTRFCVSLHPLSHKAQNLIKKPNEKRTSKKSAEKLSKDSETKIKTEDIDEAGPSKAKPKKSNPEKSQKVKPKTSKLPPEVREKANPRSKRTSSKKSYKMSSDESDGDTNDKNFIAEGSDSEDFEKPKPTKLKQAISTPRRRPNRKIVSTDSEPSSPEHKVFTCDQILCWAEVFSKPDKQWISVDCVNNLVKKPYDIERKTLQPVRYILAYDDSGYVKDVTRRYCSEYMTSTIKLRPDSDWWDETLEPFLPPNSKLNKDEEKDLESILINKPLPTTVSGYKNHPLYALKRHLLKFEAIYPPDAASVGFIRKEPVYARDNVVQLHSRETWLKEARVVRIGEDPYKIVKARPKWDRIAGVMRTDLPLNVFGFWQTEPYEPPIAVDGKVPRNEYGNVELFKPCMLPRGTVHLQLNGLNRIAKKLGIDCCAAVVGFDGHKGSVHPVYDGFVICEEFKDTILAAWDEEQENAKKREEEKREKRIYGNWKKLIRGLLIRERIKLKYDTK